MTPPAEAVALWALVAGGLLVWPVLVLLFLAAPTRAQPHIEAARLGRKLPDAMPLAVSILVYFALLLVDSALLLGFFVARVLE